MTRIRATGTTVSFRQGCVRQPDSLMRFLFSAWMGQFLRIGFQDFRYPTVQPAQLFLQFLDLRVVRFCGHVARQFIQIIQGEAITRPSAGTGYDRQTVG